jgi:hypothetical protein
MDRISTRYFVESREEAGRKGFQSRARYLEEVVFCEEVLAGVKASGAGVALASFAEEVGIASVVRRLGERGIEADLWLNLPYEQGYWQSKSNIAETEAAVDRLLDWIARERLPVRNIGLDLEVPIQAVGLLVQRRFPALAVELLCRKRPKDAQARFNRLVRRINHRHGMDLYKLPALGSSRLWKRLLGLLSIPEGFLQDPRNHVVSMLYSSVVPARWAARFVERHLREGEVPAIGILSASEEFPGVDLPGCAPDSRPPFLEPAALSRDIEQVRRIYELRRQPAEMYVYALNGPGTLEQVQRASGTA